MPAWHGRAHGSQLGGADLAATQPRSVAGSAVVHEISGADKRKSLNMLIVASGGHQQVRLQVSTTTCQQYFHNPATKSPSCKQTWGESQALWGVTQATSRRLWCPGKCLQDCTSAVSQHGDLTYCKVQVEGLDLAKPLGAEHQQLLHELWREHLLLVFRSGYLDPGSQERVLRECLLQCISYTRSLLCNIDSCVTD